MFEATRAFPFKMSLLERDSALTTPTVISRISGERTLDFTFKPKSLYRPLTKESIENVFGIGYKLVIH
jgi:hypothetical protein